MDPSTEIQTWIARRREAMIARYPAIWEKLIAGWKSPGPDDRAWLMYSANYLFRTAGVRWALDPLTLGQRLPSAPAVDAAHDLEGLSFVLLTHRHKDHLDLDLVKALNRQQTLWVVPRDILEMVEQAGVARRKILLPRHLEPIEVHGVRITPFDGLHWESAPERPEGRRGVPSVGYLVEFEGKRWLFPGDIRTYDVKLLPPFGALDGAFVHLWLGRASALIEEPPLLDSFCRFCIELHSPRIIITHLHEFGRSAPEYWHDTHINMIKKKLMELSPASSVEFAKMGECIVF